MRSAARFLQPTSSPTMHLTLSCRRPISTALLFLVVLSGCAGMQQKPDGGNKSAADLLDAPDTALVRLGKGTPPIVLQAGLGDSKRTWRTVLQPLVEAHQVVAIDRPGRNGLADTDTPRDPCSIARAQHTLLHDAGIAPPYLLVGHSLGGLYQFVYAKLYPQEVAGIVLLDPTPPYHWTRIQREAPTAAALLKTLRVVAFTRTDRAEFDDQETCLDALDLQTPLGKPAKVLVAGRLRPEEKGDFEKMMKQSRQDWTRLTGIATLDVIWDSGHFIQKDSPEDVVDAIRQVAGPNAQQPR